MLSGLVSTWSPPPHPYNRPNTGSIAHKYATAVDQPCFHSFASSWPSDSGARFAAMLLIDFFNNSSKARTHSSRECLYSRTTTGAAFFFFQAEDGIRDHCVTGVQTCALPI